MFTVQSIVLSTSDRKATSPGVESWGHNGLGPAFRPFKLIDCAEDLKFANFLGITFSFSSPPLPLPLNVLGLYWCETLVPRAVDILLYWTDGVASRLKAFQGLFWLCGWLQCRVSIPSTNLIAPLHILHWRLICTSVQKLSLGWICVDLRSSGHISSVRWSWDCRPLHMCTLGLQVAHS